MDNIRSRIVQARLMVVRPTRFEACEIVTRPRSQDAPSARDLNASFVWYNVQLARSPLAGRAALRGRPLLVDSGPFFFLLFCKGAKG